MALPEGSAELGLGAALVAFVSGFWAWMKTRAGRKPALVEGPRTAAQVADGMANAAKELVDGAVDLNVEYRRQLVFVRKQCAGLVRRVGKLSKQVASCEAKHAECETKTERQEAQLVRQEAELEKLRREFEAYTAKNPPATY